MNTFTIRSQLCFPNHINLTTHPSNPPFLIPFKTTSHLKHPKNLPPSFLPSRTATVTRQIRATKQNHINKPQTLDLLPKSQQTWKEEFPQVSPNRYSRFVILGVVSIGFVLFVIGVDDQKALALGPEGPLMEEFWDNMRRYGLYILTVSTGVAYTIFQPILELLKNPISAILILTILGGSFYIVSQVVSAMVGISDFNYEYSY
ncbi:hypothetical protein Acr_15g0018750 [Actinidia rufa]|uniref:Uncharacterized protein ycf33 n=1 Tax=Actinidia rufa TaxID=165716 RepID=A0A7J0FXR1_9ERIC|nr:hypothetical protein Acr_15g0018750 [Actinidia rufa]